MNDELVTELRADQKPLYPMQFELTKEETMRLGGGLWLIMMSLSVPILLLFEVRYILAGSRVSSAASPWMGGIGLLLLLIVGFLLQGANGAAKKSDRKAIVRNYGWAFLFGLAAFIVIGWQVVDGQMSTVGHYGSMFMVTVGTGDFYILCAMLGVWATMARVRRLDANIKNYWGVTATGRFWWFVCAVWLVLYVLMYFL